MGDAPEYAELHCHTNFSFLDGASHPEELVEVAARGGAEADPEVLGLLHRSEQRQRWRWPDGDDRPVTLPARA